MPHGRLTPLGRQLRTVLANIRPATSTWQPYGRRALSKQPLQVDNSCLTRPGPARDRARHRCDDRVRWASALAVPVREEVEEEDQWLDQTEDDGRGVGTLEGIQDDPSLSREEIPKSGEKNALEGPQYDQYWAPPDNSGKSGRVEFHQATRQLDQFQSQQTFGGLSQKQPDNALLQGTDYPMYYKAKDPGTERRLENILYSCMQHRSRENDAVEKRPKGSFELFTEDDHFINSTGHSIKSIYAWAEIVANQDASAAATQLRRQQDGQSDGVPLFVLFYMLRKPYITARTLRTLLRVSLETLKTYHAREAPAGLVKEDVFTLFTLLLRRARDVWPAAMERLVDMLLRYLPHDQPVRREDNDVEPGLSDDRLSRDITHHESKELASLAFRLNKAMRLLAIPTAIAPFRTIATQEKCVIRILRFLAEHDPPLEINRDGYRAIILIQLAQPKSDNDLLWAELKALSWPPWKEERTAVDSDIIAADQGRSKAAETLERMREAGFSPHEWERVAGIYSGWDIDGTPTIQTRLHFSSGKRKLESRAAVWTARIRTTRTIQEAWACYLAFEEQSNEHDQDVYLAMFRKLYEEEKRIESGRRYKNYQKAREAKDIWPGEAIEIEPPPPSSHQHTYTRTTPPSMDQFHRQLRKKGAVFEGPTLAFIVSRAGSFKLGIEYLLASEPAYPAIRSLLQTGTEHDLSSLPEPVFAAFMELLGRFSNYSVSKALPADLRSAKRSFFAPYIVDGLELNSDHALVHAIRLLDTRLPRYRPAWNAVLRWLGNSSSHKRILAAYISDQKQETIRNSADIAGQLDEALKAANTARRLVSRILYTMRSIYVEPDTIGIIALCNVAENLAIACWLRMRQQWQDTMSIDDEVARMTKSLKRNKSGLILQYNFMDLVGGEMSFKPSRHDQDKLRHKDHSLLEVPAPPLLHAYIRALGWIADYRSLLDVVRWMARYRGALAERREADRNGEVIMRRAIVALRVFLERSWLRETMRYPPELECPPSGKIQLDKRTQKTTPDVPQGKQQVTCDNTFHLKRLELPARRTILTEIKDLVESVEDWGGWPTEEEVEDYCQHERFQQFNK